MVDSRKLLLQHIDQTVTLLGLLGIQINYEKSCLTPTQSNSLGQSWIRIVLRLSYPWTGLPKL